MGDTFNNLSAVLTSLSVSSKNETVVTTDELGELREWDIATSGSVQLTHGNLDVQSAAVSPDGGTMAATAGGAVYLWNTATTRFTGELASPDTSPGGKHLLTADQNGFINDWSISSQLWHRPAEGRAG